jgi:hypothetical protein
MADEFIDRFQQQIDLLKHLEQVVQGAIGRAEDRIQQMRDERKPKEEVFGPVPPKQTSGAQGGGC